MLEHSGTNNAGLITLELKEQVVEIVLLKLKETELSGQEGGAGVVWEGNYHFREIQSLSGAWP